jgi:hypothetical protein
VELLVLCGVLGLVTRRVSDASFRVSFGGDLIAPLLLLTLLVAAWFAYGMSSGGERDAAIWETRGIFLLLPLFVLTVNVVRTRRDLHVLGVVVGVSMLVASVETLYRHVRYIRGSYSLEAPLDLAFNHEVSIFVAALAFALLAQCLWSRSVLRTAICGALAMVPLAALVVTHRRAGMVALDVSLVLFALTLLRTDVRRFLVLVPLSIVVVSGLLAVTWHEPGGLGQPARAFQSITGGSERADDVSSDDYRARERGNVRANIVARPVQGLGFGRQYEFPNQLPDLSGWWPLYRYLPHNSILFVWVKGGVLAYTSLLCLLALAMLRSGQLFNSFAEPALRTAALTAGACVLMFAVFAYTDLGLVTAPSVFFLGLSLGVIGALGRLVSQAAVPAEEGVG